MINLILDLVNFIKFQKAKKINVGFFCENKNIFEYLKPYILNKSKKKKILLISFEKIDFKFKNVSKFTFSTNFFREIVFLTLRLKYLYSSTPGLNFTLFKKSKFSKCKYIYLQHSLCSMTMIYSENAFKAFDGVQAVTNYQFEEFYEIKKKNKLKFKIFKSNYLFLREKARNCNSEIKKNILIAPTWNTNFFSYGFHKKLSNLLKNNNISFDLRPHPMSIKNEEINLDELNKLEIDINNDPNLNFFEYQVLISDWSGLFIEFYVLNKKVLLIDSDKKVLNEQYMSLKNQPAEIRLREKLFKNFSFDNLENIIPEIKKLIQENTKNPNKIDKFYFDL